MLLQAIWMTGYTGWSPDTLSSCGSPCGEISNGHQCRLCTVRLWNDLKFCLGKLRTLKRCLFEREYFSRRNCRIASPLLLANPMNTGIGPHGARFSEVLEERIPQSDWVPRKGEVEVLADLCVEGHGGTIKEVTIDGRYRATQNWNRWKLIGRTCFCLWIFIWALAKHNKEEEKLWSGCRNFGQDFLRKGRP